MNTLSTGPRTRPQTHPAQNETQEIIRRTQSRKKIYPNMTLDNFNNYKYRELVDPLRKNPREISKIQKEFLKSMHSVESMLKKLALSEFSYAKAKDSASSRADKALFSQLDRQVKMIQTTTAATVGNPNLEALFSAQDKSEFDSKMKDNSIVQAVYSKNPNFINRAKKVFSYIQAFRLKNKKQLKTTLVNSYLNDIFSAKKDEVENKIENSPFIKADTLSNKQKSDIVVSYNKYHLYKKRLKEQLTLEKKITEERKSVITKAVEYGKSGDKYISTQIQNMRDHWAGMDGKERTIAGLTILIGTAWFLNSSNEKMQKMRDTLMKAGLLTIGYIGVNTTSKVLFGRSVTSMAKSHVKDKSGKRDFLKKSFDTDKIGAENIETSLAVLGNYDFVEISNLYLQEEARYKKFNISDKMRGISVGGIAENEMTPHSIYSSMKLLDKKLHKKGSSIEMLNEGLKKAEEQAKTQGRTFIRPTWAMIVTAVLLNQKLGWGVDKKGKIKLTTAKEIITTWETSDKERTKMWWPLTMKPKDWRLQTVDNKPQARIENTQLDKLSSTIIPQTTPLSSIINDVNFGRFLHGFNALYTHSYSKQPSKRVHIFEDTTEKATYITSKMKVDTPTHRSKTASRIAAVESAYEQAMKNLRDTISKNPKHPLKKYVGRLSEFVQPVFGTFIGQNKNSAKQYVMFLRLVLPASPEFELRKKHEWADGNMMQEMHEKPLTSGDTLRRANFKTLASRKKVAFAGAYESFLAKTKLRKDQISEIDKVLDYYTKKFTGSGMTKKGLIRYLATHEFTDSEVRTARGLGASEKLPNKGVPTYAMIKETTLKARIKDPTNLKRAQILNTLGNIVVLASNGDKNALKTIKALDPALEGLLQTFIKAKPMAALPIFSAIIGLYVARVEAIYGSSSPRNTIVQRKIKAASEKYFSI